MENHTLFKLNRFLFFITQPPSPSPPPSTPDFFTTIFLYIKQWLTSIPNLFIALLHKLDQAIPPETRTRTRTRILTITAVSVAIILLLLLIFCFLSLIIKFILFIARTCWTILTCIVTSIFVTCRWVGVTCQALCCGPVAGVMMKAPGTAGLVISRALFEGATQAYFAALRAGALVVCSGTVVGFPGA